MCIEESEDIPKTPLDNSAYLQMRDMIIQNIGHPLPTAFDEIHSDSLLSFGDMTWNPELVDIVKLNRYNNLKYVKARNRRKNIKKKLNKK